MSSVGKRAARRGRGSQVIVPLDRLPEDVAPGQVVLIWVPGGAVSQAEVLMINNSVAILDRRPCRQEAMATPSQASSSDTSTPTLSPEDVRVETVRRGDGRTYPTPKSTVTVHLVGMLAEGGAKYISTYGSGRAMKINLGSNRNVRGLKMALSRMSLGESAIVTVPSALGYGPRGFCNGLVPPDADLIFEVVVLKVSNCDQD